MSQVFGFTMAQAKRDFQIGYMETFQIHRVAVGTGWIVFLKAGTNRGPLLQARGQLTRGFKTLDAAVAAVEEIGFKVEVLFRG